MATGLEPIRFVKNWNKDTSTREENWDEIANKTASFGIQTNNNFKQLGLDLNGYTYQFNGVGRGTQTTPVITRISTLESQTAFVGSRNIGLDLSTTSKIKIIGADGNNLSTTNKGLVSFNSTSNAGRVITRELTSNIEVTLTGAHWGLDTFGDQTDYILWVVMIDTGSSAILGVLAQGGRETISSGDTATTPGSITSLEKVLVSTAPASNYNCTFIAWVKADFDDTGNAGGENFWTIQSGIGDIVFGPQPTRVYGVVHF